mmetsp:Transcript_21076/g.54782  ORF Transcript_21076/g.54782 Transcript_21076/m.54782 type:complete len:99 (+) Transcript_21076:171-467(+)
MNYRVPAVFHHVNIKNSAHKENPLPSLAQTSEKMSSLLVGFHAPLEVGLIFNNITLPLLNFSAFAQPNFLRNLVDKTEIMGYEHLNKGNKLTMLDTKA